MKSKIVMLIAIIIATIYLSYIFCNKSQIHTLNNIPSIFDKNQFVVSQQYGGTFLLKGNQVITPITHDKKNLYVLNGKGNRFVMHNFFWSYYIDKSINAIVIEKNIININQTKNPEYQIITIPRKIYSPLIVDGNIKIYIKFINGYQLRLLHNSKNQVL